MSEAPLTESLHRKQERPVLSVFSPGDHADRSGGLSPQMTLRQFYDAYVLPCHRRPMGSDPKTETVDRTAIGYWEQITRNPPLDEIDDYDTGDFVDGRGSMIIERGPHKGHRVSPETVRKDCRHLNYIISRAGPRAPKLRKTARLLAEVPYVEPPPGRSSGEPALLTLDEIGRWLKACRYADRPTKCRIKPVQFWRSLVLFTYNTGLRIDTTMQLKWSMLDEAGWLAVPSTIFKGKRHGGNFYVNEAARAAIEPLRRHGYERVFPWYTWPGSASWLHATRRDLWASAGILRPGSGFHMLRRTLLTWLSATNDLIARFVAGHVAGNDILANHYVNHRQIVPELLERVPQPTWSDKDDVRQRTLFDFAG